MTVLAGIYPPIPTAFNEDESVAYGKLESNLQRWAELPLDGIVMPGSNSEAVFLTREERLRIWELCLEVLSAAGKHLIAGTGRESTAETIELTQQAATLGATAALVVPPTFYKPALTHETLLAHYHAVADESPIPLLVYNVPAFTGVDFSAATLIALAEHPRIVGVKDSSANVIKMATVLASRPDFLVFCGSGSALLPFLSIGAVGGIMALANIAAVPLRRLLDAFQAGRLEEARQIQLSLVELNAAITARFGVPGLKYAMSRVGFYGGPTRRPLLPPGPKARAEIDRLLARLELA